MLTSPLKLAIQMFCPIRPSVKGEAFERAETEHQMGCNDMLADCTIASFTKNYITDDVSIFLTHPVYTHLVLQDQMLHTSEHPEIHPIPSRPICPIHL